MRAITFPVMLSDAEPVFDQNIALDFSPWTLADVVPDSRRARVKITGKGSRAVARLPGRL